MNEIRSIRRIVTGKPATDGAGVKLVRVIGYNDTQDFDPFLMLDAFDSTNPEDYVKGFPWHPHRGIETITYLIRGDIAHGDSLGNKGRILDGECQWMTAGSGILHQEMPQPSERMLGTQLWLNLPAKDKMTEPKYNDIVGENVPTVAEEGLNIRIVSGNYKGTDGAFRGEYADALTSTRRWRRGRSGCWRPIRKRRSSSISFRAQGFSALQERASRRNTPCSSRRGTRSAQRPQKRARASF